MYKQKNKKNNGIKIYYKSVRFLCGKNFSEVSKKALKIFPWWNDLHNNKSYHILFKGTNISDLSHILMYRFDSSKSWILVYRSPSLFHYDRISTLQNYCVYRLMPSFYLASIWCSKLNLYMNILGVCWKYRYR